MSLHQIVHNIKGFEKNIYSFKNTEKCKRYRRKIEYSPSLQYQYLALVPKLRNIRNHMISYKCSDCTVKLSPHLSVIHLLFHSH